MTTQTSTQSYFNLHTSGIGYLNSIRSVKPKKGQPFWSCRVAALTGAADEPEYRFFDMNVVGADTVKLVKRCQEAVDAKKKVLISFVMSDLWTDTFIYSTTTDYHQKGDVGVALKGRLIRIKMIKIDGNEIYKEQPKSDERSDEQSE